MAHILVVEDEPDIREGIAEVLRDEGHRVTEAADGHDALARLGAGPPADLIVLDLMMPRMDGWQFRAAQLADPSLARIPVLVVSAHGRRPTGIPFLSKPFDLRELLRAIDALLPGPGGAHAP